MRAVLGGALLLVVALFAWWMLSDLPARRGPDRRSRDLPVVEVGDASAENPQPGDDAGGDEEKDQTADRGEPFTVQVVDEEKAPVADAWIEVFEHGRTEGIARATGRTGGMGYATLRLLENDELVAGAKGFARTQVERPLHLRLKQIVLRPGYRVAGVVVDPEGVPIAGAVVRIEEPGLNPLRTRTGSGGRFELGGLAGDVAILRVKAAGFHHDSWDAVDPGDQDVRIVLFRARDTLVIRGSVLLEDGSPAAGARVNGRVTANAEGRFELPLRGRRDYVDLGATSDTPERSRRAHLTVRLAPDGTYPPVRLVLKSKLRSWVRVRVLDKDGAPAKGRRVGGRGMQFVPFPVTDAAGRALCIFDLPPGTETSLGTIENRQDGLLPARATVVTAPPPGGEEVVLRPREAVPVTVIARGPDGEPLPPTVRVSLKIGLPVSHRGQDRATFAVDPAIGSYLVQASAWGYGRATAWIRTPRPRRMEVRLHRTGTLRCRLVDETGRLVTDGFVWTLTPGGYGSSGSDEATADGSYLVPDVPAGRVRVTAGRNDLPGTRIEAPVRPGEETDLGTLVLHAPLLVTGRVTDALGRPLGGAHVIAQEADDETGETYSHADGSFRLKSPPWFAGHLLARKRGHGAAHASAGPHVELVLPPEGKVRLSVRFAASWKPYAWSLAARDPGTDFEWQLGNWTRIAPHTYLVGELPPGRLIIVLRTSPHDAEAEVDVVAGEAVPATVVVRD